MSISEVAGSSKGQENLFADKLSGEETPEEPDKGVLPASQLGLVPQPAAPVSIR